LSAGPRRSIERRAVAAALAFALAAAPVLASLWPAFGKGPMLRTGEPAAEQATPLERQAARGAPGPHHHEGLDDESRGPGHVASAHADSASAAGHGAGHHAGIQHTNNHPGDNEHGDHDHGGIPDADGGDEPGRAAGSHHTQHCALCVLAFLGWAPPGTHLLVSPERAVVARPKLAAEFAPRASLVWDRAQARAPPLS